MSMKKSILILILLFSASLFLAGETKTVTIYNNGSFSYWLPEVQIASDGGVYVAFEARSASGSDIYLSRYKNGKVEFLKNVSESGHKSYEPDLAIESNGNIHIVWGEQVGSTCYIKYRALLGASWTTPINLGQVGSVDNIEDLHMVVDGSGNVFATFMIWPQATCHIVTKHGGSTALENFPHGGRQKHPDVAVDGSTVHVTWQYRGSGEYTIMYASKDSSHRGGWKTSVDLKHHETQRPRIDIDGSNRPHIVYWEEHPSGAARMMYYQRWDGTHFTDKRVLSNTSRSETYHAIDLAVSGVDNLVTSMQRGGYDAGDGIFYNWKRNGAWTGFSRADIGGRPGSQTIDIDKDTFTIAIAYTDRDDGVYLYLQSESGTPTDPDPTPDPVPNVPPTASFTFTPQAGLLPLDVVFNASASADSDGTIVSYKWDFGDGSIGEGVNPTHRYQAKGTFNIKLIVTDDKGATAEATGQIVVKGLEKPINLAYERKENSNLFSKVYVYKVSWNKNPANAALGANIVEYKVFRKRTSEGHFSYLTTVNASDNNLYFDKSLKKEKIDYQYAIVAVDDKGRESEL